MKAGKYSDRPDLKNSKNVSIINNLFTEIFYNFLLFGVFCQIRWTLHANMSRQIYPFLHHKTKKKNP